MRIFVPCAGASASVIVIDRVDRGGGGERDIVTIQLGYDGWIVHAEAEEYSGTLARGRSIVPNCAISS